MDRFARLANSPAICTNEPRRSVPGDKSSCPGAFSPMLRALFAGSPSRCLRRRCRPAAGGRPRRPAATGRASRSARLDACENADRGRHRLTGKDLAVAYGVRGDALFKKRDYDKAIAAYNAAHRRSIRTMPACSMRAAGPMSSKGEDDHAMADYNLAAASCGRTPPMAYNNRGTLYLAPGRAAKRARRFRRGAENQAESAIARYPTAGAC